MIRSQLWTSQMRDCSPRQFRKIQQAELQDAQRTWAREAGFNLGRVIAVNPKRVFTKTEMQNFRRQYQVEKKYFHIMLATAHRSVSYWQRWYGDYPSKLTVFPHPKSKEKTHGHRN